jgi:predicted permease
VSRTILPVWLTTLAAAIVVGITAGDAFLTWLPLVLAGVVLLTFAIQLVLSRKEELVTRMIFSIGGALVILVAATVVLAIVHPAGATLTA